jgi:hypothetical protein
MNKQNYRDIVKLPQVAPSFTSKGFHRGFLQYAFDKLKDELWDAVLVSTYDLYNDFLILEDLGWRGDKPVFLDSGGYELSPLWDSTDAKKHYYVPQSFVKKNYLDLLRDLPADGRFVIANFDFSTQHESLNVQITKATEIFAEFPNFYSNFIIKPGFESNGVISVEQICGEMDPLVWTEFPVS